MDRPPFGQDLAVRETQNEEFLDLAAVESIDQAGIDVVRMGLQAVEPDGDFVLCSITEPVMEMLREALMNRIFGVFLSLDDAIDVLT